ncbi:hypothetical protein D3C81_1839910 [compost metagenome]
MSGFLNKRFSHIVPLGCERLLGRNQMILLSCNQKAGQCRGGQHVCTIWTFPHSQSGPGGPLWRSPVTNLLRPGHFTFHLLHILCSEQSRHETINKGSDSLGLNRGDRLQTFLLSLLTIRVTCRMKQTKSIQLESISLCNRECDIPAQGVSDQSILAYP